MRRAPAGGHSDEWRRRAMRDSAWLAAQPGLAEFAMDLAATNLILREATARHAAELLRGRVPAPRLLQVAFEVFTQGLALALDLRDTSRNTDADLRKWVTRRRAGASLPDSILARVEGSGDLALAQEAASPYALTAARRLRICLESLGPTFVKFGQLLGSAHGLLAEDVVAEFSRCHDEVKPHPAAGVVAVVEGDLGPLATVFASFDPRPLASASIAQVHAAVLKTGQEVAVKVQRPGIRPRIESDVAILHRMARATEGVDLLETLNLVSMTQLFCETVVEELDFRLEAENMVELALAFEDAGHGGVCVPRPVPGLVTERVLVMQRLHGTRFGTAMAAGGDDAAALLAVGTQAVLEAALTYGVFHGDIHAGNMLVLEDGRYGLLDYGIVGRFDEAQRFALTRWLASIAAEDLPLQIEALGDLGAFPPGADLGELTKQVEVVLHKIATEDPERLGDIAHDFELIARILAAHGLRIPNELALFLKNLLHVTGQARRVAPDADPLGVAGVTAWVDGAAGAAGAAGVSGRRSP